MAVGAGTVRSLLSRPSAMKSTRGHLITGQLRPQEECILLDPSDLK